MAGASHVPKHRDSGDLRPAIQLRKGLQLVRGSVEVLHRSAGCQAGGQSDEVVVEHIHFLQRESCKRGTTFRQAVTNLKCGEIPEGIWELEQFVLERNEVFQ